MELILPVGAVLAVMIFMIVTAWRRDRVLSTATDDELLMELKRRAYTKKLLDEAASDVQEALKTIRL